MASVGDAELPPALAPGSAPPSAVTALAAPAAIAPRAPLPCRAIAVEGAVTLDVGADAGGASSAPLAVQHQVPEGWLLLPQGARLVAKDPRTTRETTFFGPARVMACVAASEESWVAQGRFESSPGAGETPGAEEWVVTPHAVVRYAAAKLRVDVRPAGTTATIGAGVAFLWPPQKGALDEGWQRLDAGEAGRAAAGSSYEGSRPLERCTTLAHRSRELATALLSGAGGESDAGTIAEQVTTRRLARAACAVARLRLGQAAEPAARETPADWAAKLAEAEAAWRSLPLAPAH